MTVLPGSYVVAGVGETGPLDESPELERLISDAGASLIATVEATLAGWVRDRLLTLAPQLGDRAAAAALRCAGEVLPALRELLAADIDSQRVTPLQIVREAMRTPTAVLVEAGVRPPHRDGWLETAEPDDIYGLAPATWADLGTEVNEAAIRWGAAKAMVHLRRHGG